MKTKILYLCIIISLSFLAACGSSVETEDKKDTGPLLDQEKHWHLIGKNGINILPAWELSQGSHSVSIAIVDLGFSPSSPAFMSCPQSYKVLDFVHGKRDINDHGTKVASFVSTCPDNPLGLVGVNQKSEVLWLDMHSFKSLPQALVYWAAGLVDQKHSNDRLTFPAKIEKPVAVVNMSYGEKFLIQEEEDSIAIKYLKMSELVNNKLDNIHGHSNNPSLAIFDYSRPGPILVAGAGNDGKNSGKIFPSAATGVISVGATTSNGFSTSFSNWGETVEIMAPGENLLAATKNGSELVNGTSFATPIISGVISLMKSVYKELNWKTATYLLQSTAVPMDCAAYCVGRQECEKDCCVGTKQTCTPGRVDAGAAVKAAAKMAQTDIVNMALIDAFPYYIKLEKSNTNNLYNAKFIVFNVGDKDGSYSISSENKELKFEPSEFIVPKKSQPQTGILVTVSSHNPQLPITAIRIASPESGKVSTFSDEITVYVGSK
jgi:hypothetical protein